MIGIVTPPFFGVYGRRNYTEAELAWLKKEYPRQREIVAAPESNCKDDLSKFMRD